MTDETERLRAAIRYAVASIELGVPILEIRDDLVAALEAGSRSDTTDQPTERNET